MKKTTISIYVNYEKNILQIRDNFMEIVMDNPLF